MLQPFVKMEKRFIEKLLTLQKFYLVSQSYTRCFDHLNHLPKTGILLSDYDDLGLARIHLNAVAHDKFASIIDLRKHVHINKLHEMLEGGHYELYWGVTKDANELKRRLDAGYKDKIRKWIEKNTHWQIAASDGVITQFEVRFGELFLIFKWRSQKASIKFEEIERL